MNAIIHGFKEYAKKEQKVYELKQPVTAILIKNDNTNS